MDRATMSAKKRLVAALAEPTAPMLAMLDLRTRQAVSLAARTDVVWYLLLQSMSTLQSSAGHRHIFPDGTEPVPELRYAILRAHSAEERHALLSKAFAKVRMGARKSAFLAANFKRIEDMGGLVAVTAIMRGLKGRDAKTAWVRRFDGIGQKYARNFWMDIRDHDFEQSIAVDLRLESVGRLVGMGDAGYQSRERFFLDIARDAGRSGWEVDRLIYNFRDELLWHAGIDDQADDSGGQGASRCPAR